MRFCVACGRQIDDSAVFCPYCRGQQPQIQQPRPQQPYQPNPPYQAHPPYQPNPPYRPNPPYQAHPPYQPNPPYQAHPPYRPQPPQAAVNYNTAAQKTLCYVFLGPENELNKALHEYGDIPEGSLEVYRDRIDVYVRGGSPVWTFFGLAGDAAYPPAIPYDMISSYATPQMGSFILYLKDGNLLYVSGLFGKGIADITAFLNGKPMLQATV